MSRQATLILLLILLLPPSKHLDLAAQCYPICYQDLARLEDYSDPQCLNLYQDCRGLLWINNRTGLDRWDGNKMVNYPYIPFDTTAFPARQGASITGDDRNNIWISYGSLARFDLEQEVFHRIDLDCTDQDLRIKYTAYDPEGFLWLVCEKKILQYYPETRLLEKVPMLDNSGKEVSSFQPRKILADTTGRIWLADGLHGLCYLDKGKQVFMVYPMDLPEFADKNMNLEEVNMDPDGIFWLFGARAELASFNPYNGELHWAGLPVYSQFAPSTRGGMVIDKTGKIWFGVDQGLKLYEPSTRTLRSMDTPADHLVVLDMILDQQGNILIATFEGIKIIDARAIQVQLIDLETPLLQEGLNWITSVSRQNEFLWMGTYKTGIIRYNLETKQSRTFQASGQPGFSNFQLVRQTLRDREGRIWFTADQSLYRVNKDQESFEYFDTGPSHMLTQDEEGFFWILHPDRLVRFDPVQLDSTHILFHRPLPFQEFRTAHDLVPFVKDKEGIFWIAQLEDGLYRIDPREREWERYSYDPGDPEGLPDQNILDLYCDSRGTVWLSSWVGPSRMIKKPDSPGEIRFDNHFITELHMNSSSRISEDTLGNIYVGTTMGLKVIRPDEHVDTYDHRDGLPKDPSIIWMVDRDHENGNMYLGSSKVAVLPPSFFEQRNYTTPTLLTEFRLKGAKVIPGKKSPLKRSVLLADRIELRHNQNFFRIDFAIPTLSYPERNTFRHILKGIDEDTIFTEGQSYAEYTNLAPGNYTFWVSGAINQGPWDPDGASIRIRIRPPWYRTQFALGLYLVLCCALVMGYIRIRTIRFTREKIRLEAAVKKRTEVIRSKNRQIMEMDALKTRFFTNISHEFRTLATMVKAPVSSLLEEEKITQRGKRDLEVVYRNSDRLMQLVDQLLDISRIDKKSMKLDISERNIFDFSQGIAVSFASLAEVKGIRYQYSLPLNNGLESFDADKIEKVIYNLLSNAFKFTEEGGQVCLDMDLRKNSNDMKSMLEIKVTDTGTGIPEEEQKKIFDRFYQAESHLKGHGNGTGIGLALVNDLVKLMHGSIALESRPGVGSTFTVTLPLGTSHLEKREFNTCKSVSKSPKIEFPLSLDFRERNVASRSARTKDDKKPVLLVVEDNPDILWFVATKLKTDFKVLEAVDGSAGMKLAITHMPDLIITDLIMPRMNGTELCQKLKTDLRTSHIPVIMLTAKTSMEDKLAGLDVGADDYISKPFEIKELKTRVRNLIKQRERLKEKYSKEITLDPRDIVITPADEVFLNRIMKIIERHMSNELLDVTKLCNEMSMSQSTLYRKLDALTGQSPVEFIRTMRLKRAAALMKEQYGNISQIALEVGFSNPSYFSKMFKTMFSVSPTEFVRLQSIKKPGKSRSRKRVVETKSSAD